MVNTPIQRRSLSGTEIRADDGDGRNLDILAVKWNVFDEIGSIENGYGFRESYDRHSFDETLRRNGPSKIRLLGHHDARANPIGVLTEAWADDIGLHVRARLSDTAQGRDTATLIADGALSDVSIGFRPRRDKWSNANTTVVRLEVEWRELSIVNNGALADAKIVAARSEQLKSITPEQAQRRLRLLSLPR